MAFRSPLQSEAYTPKPVRIISDFPKKETAEFGFQAYVNTIAGLIANKENETPLVIGIYGKWGSGKTTLMQNIQTELNNPDRYPGQDRQVYRSCKTVWFQAWKYKDEDEILAALIQEIFTTMEREGFFTRCRAKIEELVKRLDKARPAAGLIKKMTGVNESALKPILRS